MFKKVGAIEILDLIIKGDNWRDFVKDSSIYLTKEAIDNIIDENPYINKKDFVFYLARFVSAGEKWGYNGNRDYFPREELEKNFNTFLHRGVYVNHDNYPKNKAIGIIPYVVFDKENDYVYGVLAISRQYQEIIDKIDNGQIDGTSMGCFTPDMRVVMADGSLKCIINVKAGDKVITHKGNIKKVLNLQKHLDKANSDVYAVKVQGLPVPIKATEEHPFLVLKEQTHCYVTGDPIRGTSNGFDRFKKRMKLGAYQMKAYKKLSKEEKIGYEYEWKKAKDLTNKDILVFPKIKEYMETDVTVGKARLLGYFLAEGNYIKYKDKLAGVEFSFALDEKDTLVKEVEELFLNEFPKGNAPKIYIRKDKNISVIRVNGKTISEWFFKYCGEYSYEKKLNQEISFWDDELIKNLVGAYINGDGCKRRIFYKNNFYENLIAVTVSENLAYQIKGLLAKVEIYCRLEKRQGQLKWDAQGIDVRLRGKSVGDELDIKERNRDIFNIVLSGFESIKLNEYIEEKKRIERDYLQRLNQTNDYIVMPIHSIKKEKYKGEVYNLEVEDDNSFIIEGVTVHNCIVNQVRCPICGAVATDVDSYCIHLANKIEYDAYDICEGDNFIEQSVLDDEAPADGDALIAMKLAKKNKGWRAKIKEGVKIVDDKDNEIDLEGLKAGDMIEFKAGGDLIKGEVREIKNDTIMINMKDGSSWSIKITRNNKVKKISKEQICVGIGLNEDEIVLAMRDENEGEFINGLNKWAEKLSAGEFKSLVKKAGECGYISDLNKTSFRIIRSNEGGFIDKKDKDLKIIYKIEADGHVIKKMI